MALAEQTNIQIDTMPSEATVLTVTPQAVSVIQKLLEDRAIPNHVLRVFVSGGGCSGMQYGMAFEEAPQDFDEVIAPHDNVRLVIDPTSRMYLQGAVIDFVDSLMGGGFRIENPNAVSSCGCGSSFRTESDSAEGDAGCGTCSH